MKKEQFTFNDTTLEVHTTRDEKQWYMTVEEVARAYGVERQSILWHLNKRQDEIRAGIEKGVSITDTLGGKQEITVIYREGVIKLGFFMRGERAKAFRQFATDLVIQNLDKTGNNSAEGFSAIFDRFDILDKKIDNLSGIEDTVFGDDKEEIMDLVKKVAQKHGVDGRTVWGWIQTECDVNSYKKQNNKIKNFLKNKLGGGIRVAREEEES